MSRILGAGWGLFSNGNSNCKKRIGFTEIPRMLRGNEMRSGIAEGPSLTDFRQQKTLWFTLEEPSAEIYFFFILSFLFYFIYFVLIIFIYFIYLSWHTYASLADRADDSCCSATISFRLGTLARRERRIRIYLSGLVWWSNRSRMPPRGHLRSEKWLHDIKKPVESSKQFWANILHYHFILPVADDLFGKGSC